VVGQKLSAFWAEGVTLMGRPGSPLQAWRHCIDLPGFHQD
jgi:hypothetical protein